MKRNNKRSELVKFWLDGATALLIVVGLIGIYWMLSMLPIHEYRSVS